MLNAALVTAFTIGATIMLFVLVGPIVRTALRTGRWLGAVPDGAVRVPVVILKLPPHCLADAVVGAIAPALPRDLPERQAEHHAADRDYRAPGMYFTAQPAERNPPIAGQQFTPR
jgi:hypothetical protein